MRIHSAKKCGKQGRVVTLDAGGDGKKQCYYYWAICFKHTEENKKKHTAV